MRTQEELFQRYLARKDHDMFGFETGEYLRGMERNRLERLREMGHIKEDADLSEWEPDLNNGDALAKCMHEYMPFAWDKANNCRGISAWRSLAHYIAWLWMAGEEGFDNLDDYEFYGKPQLERICDYLRLDASQWDDGIRSNTEY